MSEPLLYHGTRAGFRGSGGIVLPGDQVGKENHGLSRSHVVYVTPDLHLAWAYANVAKGRGKPKVLVVRPFGPMGNDDSTIMGGDEQVAFTCEGAYVVRVLHDPPLNLAYDFTPQAATA